MDSWGQRNDTWSDVCCVWANFKTISGTGFVNQEFVAGGQEVSRSTASVRIRFRDDIQAGMRVILDGRYYDIKVVLPDEEWREYVDLGVAFGANDG